MSGKPERQAARSVVADYHHAQLGELVARGGEAVDRYGPASSTRSRLITFSSTTPGRRRSCGSSATPSRWRLQRRCSGTSHHPTGGNAEPRASGSDDRFRGSRRALICRASCGGVGLAARRRRLVPGHKRRDVRLSIRLFGCRRCLVDQLERARIHCPQLGPQSAYVPAVRTGRMSGWRPTRAPLYMPTRAGCWRGRPMRNEDDTRRTSGVRPVPRLRAAGCGSGPSRCRGCRPGTRSPRTGLPVCAVHAALASPSAGRLPDRPAPRCGRYPVAEGGN